MKKFLDEFDLDTILSELLELENQLSADGGDHLIYGLPSLPPLQQKIPSSNSYNQQLYIAGDNSLNNYQNLNSSRIDSRKSQVNNTFFLSFYTFKIYFYC